jgi:hypothetical protein
MMELPKAKAGFSFVRSLMTKPCAEPLRLLAVCSSLMMDQLGRTICERRPAMKWLRCAHE